jgi:hypothetical protein
VVIPKRSEESLIHLYPAGAPRIDGSAAPAVSIAVALRGHSERSEESLRHWAFAALGAVCELPQLLGRRFLVASALTSSFRTK